MRFYKQKYVYANLVNMSQNFRPGDFLVFQLEAGFALLRFLRVDENGSNKVWHIAAYDDFFLGVESAEAAAAQPQLLRVSNPHMALTTRAFESTQVARLINIPLTDTEQLPLDAWDHTAGGVVSDRSVRLMLGLR